MLATEEEGDDGDGQSRLQQPLRTLVEALERRVAAQALHGRMEDGDFVDDGEREDGDEEPSERNPRRLGEGLEDEMFRPRADDHERYRAEAQLREAAQRGPEDRP